MRVPLRLRRALHVQGGVPLVLQMGNDNNDFPARQFFKVRLIYIDITSGLMAQMNNEKTCGQTLMTLTTKSTVNTETTTKTASNHHIKPKSHYTTSHRRILCKLLSKHMDAHIYTNTLHHIASNHVDAGHIIPSHEQTSTMYIPMQPTTVHSDTN